MFICKVLYNELDIIRERSEVITGGVELFFYHVYDPFFNIIFIFIAPLGYLLHPLTAVGGGGG